MTCGRRNGTINGATAYFSCESCSVRMYTKGLRRMTGLDRGRGGNGKQIGRRTVRATFCWQNVDERVMCSWKSATSSLQVGFHNQNAFLCFSPFSFDKASPTLWATSKERPSFSVLAAQGPRHRRHLYLYCSRDIWFPVRFALPLAHVAHPTALPPTQPVRRVTFGFEPISKFCETVSRPVTLFNGRLLGWDRGCDSYLRSRGFSYSLHCSWYCELAGNRD